MQSNKQDCHFLVCDLDRLSEKTYRYFIASYMEKTKMNCARVFDWIVADSFVRKNTLRARHFLGEYFHTVGESV